MKCPNCNAEISDTAKFCLECGNKIDNKSKCPKCGAEILENSKFCPECGNKIDNKKFCPKCGAKIQENVKFCQECGTQIDGKRTCKKCGTELQENEKFCPECGNPYGQKTKVVLNQVEFRKKEDSINNDKIYSTIRHITIDKLGVEASEVHRGASLANDLGADSLDRVEITMSCEKEFGISINDDESANVDTVGDLADLVEKEIKKKKGI